MQLYGYENQAQGDWFFPAPVGLGSEGLGGKKSTLGSSVLSDIEIWGNFTFSKKEEKNPHSIQSSGSQ